MLRSFLPFGLSLLACAPASAPAEQQRIEISDFVKLVSLADPEISPDGKSIAVVVYRANLTEDRMEAQLVLVDVASGAQRVLAPEQRGPSLVRWSPHGERLGFLALSGSGKDMHPQVVILTLVTGKADTVTEAAVGVEQFAWSPDGNEIAYVTADEPPNKKETEAHKDAFKVGDNSYLATQAPTPSHIWIVPAQGGKARRVTSGSWSVKKNQGAAIPGSPLSWSPDGRFLLFGRQATPYSGDEDQTVLEVLDVATGALRKLTNHKTLESLAAISPDGSLVAYSFAHEPGLVNESDVYVTSFKEGGDGRDLTRQLDRDTRRGIWTRDGQALLIEAHDGTRSSMWLQPLQGPAKKLDLGPVNPADNFWVGASTGPHGEIAFVGTTASHPGELYYVASPTIAPRRLTDFNQQIDAMALGGTEGIEWQGPDGFREDGVLVYPPDFVKTKKYPLVLLIHGGPEDAAVESFNILPQVIAAHGYVVFSPNYRGSDNLGNAYQHAVAGNAGVGPGRDVMAGVSAVVKRGFVDESRIAVTGHSYGGFMTAWLIGHSHMWKCAVAVAAVTNFVDWYDLSDVNVQMRYLFSGFRSPWVADAMKDYEAQSPMTYASHATTPTLILADADDYRVPVVQSYELYHALRDNGVTVEFYVYPVGGHFPGDPVRIMDNFERWIGWLDRYLR